MPSARVTPLSLSETKKMGEGSPEYYEKMYNLVLAVYNHLKSSIG